LAKKSQQTLQLLDAALSTIRRVKLQSTVGWLAGFWGAVVFMPLGVNYLAFLLMLLAMLLLPGRAERWARLRAHPVAWVLAALLALTVITLALQPRYYAETPANFWHGVRIALTIGAALALTRCEALMALRGFALAFVFSLGVVGAHALVNLPNFGLWNGLLKHGGNKSVSNALLFALAAGAALTIAKAVLSVNLQRSLLWALAASLSLGAVLLALPSRTAALGWLVAMALVVAHQWRGQWFKLAAMAGAVAVLSVTAYFTSPDMRVKFEQGVAELERAQNGVVAIESWGIRYFMYKHTGQMIAEKPLTGWGVGAWNDEWKRRVPDLLDNYNMPHNDFLWMGAQSGLLGSVVVFALFAAGIAVAWRSDGLGARLALMAWVSMTVATTFNSAMRDAAIGLSMLWIAAVMLRLSSEPIDPQQPLALKH
jgi:O-antigen ligase